MELAKISRVKAQVVIGCAKKEIEKNNAVIVIRSEFIGCAINTYPRV